MVGTFHTRKRQGEALATPSDSPSESTRIPILEEELFVETRKKEGDTVRADIMTQTELETVSSELMRETVEVNRIPVGKVVSSLPVTRTLGDTTIIPVLKERLVVKKELVLVEEIHLVHARTQVPVSRDVELRRQTASVTRTPAKDTTR